MSLSGQRNKDESDSKLIVKMRMKLLFKQVLSSYFQRLFFCFKKQNVIFPFIMFASLRSKRTVSLMLRMEWLQVSKQSTAFQHTKSRHHIQSTSHVPISITDKSTRNDSTHFNNHTHLYNKTQAMERSYAYKGNRTAE